MEHYSGQDNNNSHAQKSVCFPLLTVVETVVILTLSVVRHVLN